MSIIPLGLYGAARPKPVQLLNFRSASFEPQPATSPEVYPVSLGPEHPNRQVILMVTWTSAGNDNLAVPSIDGMPFDVGAEWSQNSGYGGSRVYRLDYPTGDNVSILIEGSSYSRMNTAISVWVTYEDLAVHTLFSGAPTTLPASIYLPAGVPYIYGIGANQLDSPVVSGADITHIASTVGVQRGRTIVEGVSTGTVALSVSGIGTPGQAKQSFVAYAQVPNIAPGTPVFDSFDRPNATWGLGFADSGHLWQQIGTSMVGIIDGLAYRVANPNAFAVVDYGQVDMHVSLTATVLGAYFAGPVARVSDASNFYYLDTFNNGTTARARKIQGGVEVGITGSSIFTGTVNGDRLGISCKEVSGGTEVKIYRNGAVLQTLLDTDPARPMGTRAGIRPYNQVGIRMDDFYVGTPQPFNPISFVLLDHGTRTNNPPADSFSWQSDGTTQAKIWLRQGVWAEGNTMLTNDGQEWGDIWPIISSWDRLYGSIQIGAGGPILPLRITKLQGAVGKLSEIWFDSITASHSSGTPCTFTLWKNT